MAVRSTAAPPTPWSQSLAEPQIHSTAYVHSFANLIGDVRIGPNVIIAPGTCIRADEGNGDHIGRVLHQDADVAMIGMIVPRPVSDHDHNTAACTYRPDRGCEGIVSRRVKVGVWLVEYDKKRLTVECARQGDTLTLAAG